MNYVEHDKLTIIELVDNQSSISFQMLAKIIENRPANVIYCEQAGKLCGIISLGDVLRATEAGIDYVNINTHFTYIHKGQYMNARKIFHDKASINSIPVVDQNDVLLGAYSNWDDLQFIKNEKMILGGGTPYTTENQYWHVAAVCPCGVSEEKRICYDLLCQQMLSRGIIVDRIGHDEILDYVEKVDYIIFVDEDERRTFDTLLLYVFQYKVDRKKLVTYKNYKKKMERINPKFLHDLQNAGICIMNMGFVENDYSKWLRKNIRKKFADIGEKPTSRLPKTMYQEFFDDLYTEEYADAITQIPFSIDNKSGCGKLKDHESVYYNVSNGERCTVGQPLQYQRTVYFMGPCYVYGYYVEDKNTLQSFLQAHINNAEYKIRVVNCGSPLYSMNANLIFARIREIPLRKGDILLLAGEEHTDFPIINLMDALEKNDVSCKWFIDSPIHGNHKINAIYAKAVYEALEPLLSEKVTDQGRRISYNRNYIKEMFIDKYFSNFQCSRYEKIGSIVMNCNPFTYGHQYLIEQALSMVDFLIVFVVEENKSVFSFTERFAMVIAGTADFDNVMVVPSGPFILAQTTFPEYFIKEADEDLVRNTENDITIFAEKIAPPLHIKYRFVGEEPEDIVTNEYNLAMKRILPKHGIELVEIPRKEQDGRYISASSARKSLEKNDMEEFSKLVPKSTRRVLFGDEE